MSSSGIHQRPSLWSYISFSSNGNSHARRRSVSLPAHRQSVSSHDQHEKRLRDEMSNGSVSYYSSHPPPMRRAQKVLYLRIAALAAVVFVVIFFLYPSEKKATVEEFIHGKPDCTHREIQGIRHWLSSAPRTCSAYTSQSAGRSDSAGPQSRPDQVLEIKRSQ